MGIMKVSRSPRSVLLCIVWNPYPAFIGDVASEEKGRTIFGANYDRLIELKKRFDPSNAFGKGHLLSPQFDGK